MERFDATGIRAIAFGAAALFLVLAAFTIVIGRGGLADLASSSSAVASVEAAESTVLVMPGDTVWSIARRLQPRGDVRGLVDEIVALNGGADILAGEHLLVPR